MSIDTAYYKLTIIISKITQMIEDLMRVEYSNSVRGDASVNWKTGCGICSHRSRNAVKNVTSCQLPNQSSGYDMSGSKFDSCSKGSATSLKTEQLCDLPKSCGSVRVTDDELDCRDHDNSTATLVENPNVEKPVKVIHDKSKMKLNKLPSPSKSKPPSWSSTDKRNTRKRPDSRKNVVLR